MAPELGNLVLPTTSPATASPGRPGPLVTCSSPAGSQSLCSLPSPGGGSPWGYALLPLRHLRPSLRLILLPTPPLLGLPAFLHSLGPLPRASHRARGRRSPAPASGAPAVAPSWSSPHPALQHARLRPARRDSGHPVQPPDRSAKQISGIGFLVGGRGAETRPPPPTGAPPACTGSPIALWGLLLPPCPLPLSSTSSQPGVPSWP